MSAEEIEKSGLLGRSTSTSTRRTSASSDRATLAKNADALKKFDFLRITVEGHCDERGTVEYNLALGERRARAAYDYLVSLGVPADRLKIVSYGKEVPVCTQSERGVLAEEPPRPLHGDRQDEVAPPSRPAHVARAPSESRRGRRPLRPAPARHLTLRRALPSNPLSRGELCALRRADG